jgi:protein involved in polysaccharide export with SLBB domain
MRNFKSTADTTYFLIRRAGEATANVPRSGAAGFPLKNNDVIIIPSLGSAGTQDTVRISGEVVRKGTFPIAWGKSTAAEIIELSGGFTADADPKRAFVIRSSKLPKSASPSQNQPAGSPMQTGLRSPQIFAYGVRPEINASLNDLMATNDYAVLRLGEHPESVRLENGDEIHVPRREYSVYVSGQVKNPGAYPYFEGGDADHYVNMAGGLSGKADRKNLVVMTRYNEITQFRDGSRVDQGDVVVVPASVENKQFTTIYLPVTQAFISVLGLVITYLALSGAIK